MRKSIQKSVVVKKETPGMSTQSDEKKYSKCHEVIEYLKTLSKSKEKCVESVILSQSQYPSCSSIMINLTEALSSKMTSTYIAVEGEAKIYKNKKDVKLGEQYFLKIKLSATSPILYQLLENIYTNIKEGKKVPPSLVNISINDLDEKTLNKGCLYINKMNGAIIEYKVPGNRSIVQSMIEELESLSKRDKQMAKAIIVPIVLYKNSETIKVTFALKKLIMERDFSANIVDVDGKSEKFSMAEVSEEDSVRGLGVIELEDECLEEDDNNPTSTLFNV
ncbi:putative DNA-binding phosphoprotein [Lumpy skin disease virus]|uniref:Protein OPG079 n=1 Tax=Lumpy skin disease virus TaxID=59509 RepID=Q91MW2_LSDV|nr:DNA-binding phosphoprotein [Lumpy skin disease virus NI-2490]AAN02613.1 putative DNA-binding phosphoprotein [Lumpy skin disease virus NW-LW]AOE47621.1 DNA-binding phosphoprotein [Lumpy skin disease virus]AAK85006.1 LSDV045 putative DNA-binding phosphoprotein [Lumpy skin disease virus NI-2490]ARO77353.1 putative DNA-binding phosphoprotein [Lumpy skin disease virus]ART89371.1 putative DNA-binding phosphoprotein [Lumpy skin disease virus]